MKISYQWICESLGQPVALKQLCEDLTQLGLEVGSVQPVSEDLQGVVVAEITSTQAHPNADKLKVCTVDDGENHYQIICGAENARASIKVALAKVGARLPNKVKIKRSKIRGVESQGMLCSARELGLGDDHLGILELNDDALLGDDLKHFLGLDDRIIDIELTPNRGDCFSLRGVKRELCALYRIPYEDPTIHLPDNKFANPIEVNLVADQACTRFCGVLIKGSELSKETPQWMCNRLAASGMRSLSLVVDITNYVMLELGQPLHAYDAAWVQSGICVRMAKENESLRLLDSSELELNTDLLLISNNATPSVPLGLAGIMGGDSSKVTTETESVYFEAAHFTPDYLLGKARNLGMQTDASLRFERGVDPTLPPMAVARAAELLIEIAGGQCSELSDDQSAYFKINQCDFNLNFADIRAALGIDVDYRHALKFLSRLGFQLTPQSIQPADNANQSNELLQTVSIQSPPHRFDMAIVEDIYEEIARFIGYQQFLDTRPDTQPDTRRLSTKAFAKTTQTERMVGVKASLNKRQLRHLLANLGLNEVITYSFVSDEWQRKFIDKIPITLVNPISEDMNVMRLSLLPGLMMTAQYNLNHQYNNPLLFEIGKCYSKVPDEDLSFNSIRQVDHVAGVFVNAWSHRHWLGDETIEFFRIKGFVEKVLAEAGFSVQKRNVQFQAENDNSHDSSYVNRSAHPHQCARILINDQCIGHVGMFHPKLLNELDSVTSAGFFEMQLDPILSQKKMSVYQQFVNFPTVSRDLAVVVPEGISYAQLTSEILSWQIRFLDSVRLFDVYMGENIPQGYKSLAINFKFVPQKKTFSDNKIEALMKQISTKLNEHDCTVRG